MLINFQEISIYDKELFCKYLSRINTNSYEYLFSSLYLWRKCCKTCYSIIDNTLVLKKFNEENKSYFMMPYGYNYSNLSKIIKELLTTSTDDSIFFFGDVEYNFVKDLKIYTNYDIEIIKDINHYEYVYLTNNLINLPGNKYHGKRNHLNNFIRNNNYVIKDISNDTTISDCIALIETWHKNREVFSKELLYEKEAIIDVLKNYELLNLKTIAIYINDNLIGFSIGEKVNNTAVIHIERCNKEITGSYAFINREFLTRNFSDTIYVNRQEDCGMPGIRKSKQSYYPDHMIEKYIIKIS